MAKRPFGPGVSAATGVYGRGLPPRYGTQQPPPAEAADPTVPAVSTRTLGALAPLTLVASGALIVVALADGASRSGKTWGTPVFWVAIFAAAAIFGFRVAGARAGRVERLGLVLVFGLFLYGVKILRDPTGFTFADELVHAFNVNSIVSSHSLFAPNPILPVTPHYPGLETSAAAVHLVGGGTDVRGRDSRRRRGEGDDDSRTVPAVRVHVG